MEDGTMLVAMAFADDVIIVDDKEEHLALSLRQAEEFFKQRGIEISSTKSYTMSSVCTKGNTISRTKPLFRIANHLLPMVSHLNSIKYLGHHFSTSGSLKPSLAALPTWLLNLSRSCLKPHQKFNILRNYIIPRLMYGLQTPRVTGQQLRECNALIRKNVKQILHLNKHTANQYLHAAVKDGVTDFRNVIPHIFLARLEKLRTDSDKTTSALLSNQETNSLIARLRRLALPGPPDAFWREEVIKSTFSNGLEAAIEDASSRNWIFHPPPGWSGGHYVRAVQPRTGNLTSPTYVILMGVCTNQIWPYTYPQTKS